MASRLLQTCPQLLGVRPRALRQSLEAVANILGVPLPEAARLVAPQPMALARDPQFVELAVYALVKMAGGDAARARALVERQPSLLLFSGEEWDGARVGCWCCGLFSWVWIVLLLLNVSHAPSSWFYTCHISTDSGLWSTNPNPKPLIDKLRVLGDILGLGSQPGHRRRLMTIVAAAPNLLTRSASALQASWDALRTGLGKERARDLLLGAGAPVRLLAYSSGALAARAGALQQLSGLSGDWASRVEAARADPRQLAAVMAAREAASARLQWLVESKQLLAPGGIGLVDLIEMEDAAFCDIYPQWRARAAAA
jgi:hypothetical protein